VLCAASVAAQEKKEAPKPPEEVDKALRSRIDFFYQAHVNGKFRLADQAVAEESKDDFFAAPKRRYEKCEIRQIAYSEDFSTAHVVELCKTEMMVHGTRFPITAPIPSDWKQQDGQWYLFYKKVDQIQTPFGPMKVRDPKEAAAAGAPAPLPRIDPAALARDILKQVRLDRSEVVLDPTREGSAELKIQNGMPGAIQVSIVSSAEVEGLSVALDRSDVPAGATGAVSVRFKPGDQVPSGSAQYRVLVQPTGQFLPFAVKFVHSN
jgi:hypothetical protein